MSSTSDFVHLHLHSQYSLLDGAVRLDDLMTQVRAFGMPAVAVTDHGNMFGAVDFYLKAIAAGVKPIIGSEVYVAAGDRRDRTSRAAHHLILLARNDEGYQNLMFLVSMGYLEGFYYHPRIDKPLLGARSAGLIGATSCLGGEVATAFREGGYERAKEAARSLRDLFEPGHFFLEVQNNGYAGQIEYNAALRRMGAELELPLIATNDTHFLAREDAQAHRVLMCIQKGVTLDDPKADKRYTDEIYFRSAAEMKAALPEYLDAIENTLKVAEMCVAAIDIGHNRMPEYKAPGDEPLPSYLRRTAHEMLNRRFEEFDATAKIVDRAAYRKRLDSELDVICNMGFPGYFLIVHDFIAYAKGKGIPVGPGRGSGAGSLVAYSLRITDLDPIPLNLLFERFLNPERVSMPDFDIDFCKDRREEVISYVTEKYGRDNVGQIATFHLMKSRSVVRDVGRAMGMAYGDVDRIAKLIPEGPEMSLAAAYKAEPRLGEARKKDRRVDELLSYAERLENLNRHAGMHAAGVVISSKPLWEHVPVFRTQDRDQVTHVVCQYDMKHVEKVGLVKFDFLGLKTLTIIDTAVGLISKRPDRKEPLDILKLKLDDEKVYRLISSGDTLGVFQLESRGFQELVRRLQPDCFEDIVAAVALYRPGPLEGGMVDQFVECKHGRMPIKHLHPRLEPILKETYGVIVYQEQVMQAAQILAGYSLGAADIMRRAMGKKKPEEMEKERLKFVSGAVQRGILAASATEIFDLIDKFAGYGFNKSHSAAYALITYQTAWLKAHYPVEFEAAMLTCQREETDRIAKYVAAGREHGVEVLPPDINESDEHFKVIYPPGNLDGAAILFGLSAIKGVGQAALASILEARREGPFADIFEFCRRIDLAKVNRAVVESLVKAGAFDSLTARLKVNRGQIFGVLDRALEQGRTAQRDRETGQTSLFGMLGGGPKGEDRKVGQVGADYFDTKGWDEREVLAAEQKTLGFFMSGHPMARHAKEAERLTDTTSETVAGRRQGEKVTLAGVVMEYKEKTTKQGKRLATFALEDLSGRTEVVAYSEALAKNGPVLTSGDPLFVTGAVRVDSRDGEEERVVVMLDEAMPLQEVRHRRTREVHVHVDAEVFGREATARMKTILEGHPGRCDAFLEVVIPGRSVTTVALPESLRVAPSDEFIAAMSAVDGVETIEFR
ncbi:MAG: DNA polymerase III subunit alpha [Deltaproteobacteria bacterium]|nr:DNA polymerase III subunit alpha [Deltaproteobacteria bacterium]